MPTVADYPDAVQRIANAEVDPNSTTAAQVAQDLSGAEAPQVTREVAEGVADAIVTEDRVIETIEKTGELPSEAELGAVASAADDYGMTDRVDAVTDEVSQRVATVEEVREAVGSARRGDRPTFREDVESAVDQLASRQEFVGESPNEVASDQAREVGAPRRGDYERARTRLAMGDDQVTPADVLGDQATEISGVGETTANQPTALIRDESGDAVALTGAPTQEAGERMAQEIGADYVSINEVNESIGLDQSEGRATLTFRGRDVGEVSVE